MKKTGLIHPDLLAAIAELGHLDELLVCDAGYPIPVDVPRIDLAYRPGMPPFRDVLAALVAELALAGAVIATEASDDLARDIADLVGLAPERVPHDALKRRAVGARVAVRTGEYTPYANVLLVMGVPF
jgi:D-ribose pyranase